MRLREEHPTDVINRALALEDIYRNYELEDVFKVNPKFVEITYDEEDKEFKLLNLEYAFFEAPLVEVKFLIETLFKQKQINQTAEEKIQRVADAMMIDGMNQDIPAEEIKNSIAEMIMKKD